MIFVIFANAPSIAVLTIGFLNIFNAMSVALIVFVFSNCFVVFIITVPLSFNPFVTSTDSCNVGSKTITTSGCMRVDVYFGSAGVTWATDILENSKNPLWVDSCLPAPNLSNFQPSG